MVKKTKKETHPDDPDLLRKPETEGEPSDEHRDSLMQRLEEKEKEAAANYDRYVRTVADLENYKKRAAREKADFIKFGNEQLIKDILPLTDALDRALEQATQSNDFEAFKKGLVMLQEQLKRALQKHGVEPIECLNQAFDPNLHEAMLQMESGEHENNHVMKEFEKGYLLNGRLLRPARVCVCKRLKADNCHNISETIDIQG